MKILFYDFNYPALCGDEERPFGGASIQAQKWMQGLRELGQEVGVLVADESKMPKKGNGIEFVHSFNPARGLLLLNWFYRYRALDRAVRNFRPDFIYHPGAGFTSWVLARIARKNKARFIYRVTNDADTDARLATRLPAITRFFFRRSLKNTQVILAQNSYQYENLKKLYPEKQIATFYNPFVINSATPDGSPKRNYIAWLGIFQAQKNLPALLDVVRNCPELEFCIAGKAGGKLDSATQQALNELQECENVKMLGYLKRTEIQPFLQGAILLLNTSHFEGFSNTFLEAFAAGTPVIATAKVDPDGIIAKHGLGLVCPSHSGLAAAVKTLPDSPDYQKVSSACRTYLQDFHDYKILSRKLLDYLEKVSRKQICVFIESLQAGGAEKQSLLLTKALQQTYPVTLMVLRRENPQQKFVDEIEASGINLLVLQGNPIQKLLVFARFLRNANIDVVFCFLASNNLYGAIAGRFAGVKHIFGGIRNSETAGLKLRVQRFLHNNFLCGTIFNNYSGRQNHIAQGFKAETCFVIPNGIEINTNELARNGALPKKIITAARFVAQKDYGTALRVFDQLLRRSTNSVPVHYTIIGHGVLEQQIRDEIARLDLKDYVTVLINPPNINQYLQESDIYLCTSVFEGVSNSIMEAMSFSLPVVATDAGDNAYLVKDGLSGFICEAGNVEQIADRLKYLLQNPDVCNAMGRQSYQRLQQNYSMTIFGKSYDELIDSL